MVLLIIFFQKKKTHVLCLWRIITACSINCAIMSRELLIYRTRILSMVFISSHITLFMLNSHDWLHKSWFLVSKSCSSFSYFKRKPCGLFWLFIHLRILIDKIFGRAHMFIDCSLLFHDTDLVFWQYESRVRMTCNLYLC